jgi:tungstate transport system ATP-binding protein
MNASAAPVFEARDLAVKRGGALILDIASFVIEEGEIFVLIGPNGAGKSTLLQSLSALLTPSRGSIFFKGSKIGIDIPLLAYRRKLAMVLQDPLLFDTTVYHNVASGLKIRGMKKSAIDPVVGQALSRFGITHLKDRSARTLSGGEARRASLARAFATDPEVLLLDEPFSALDPIMRETLLEDLEQVLRETRITTIFVTHDRMEALRLATRLGVMVSGKILQIGPPDDVMNHPVNELVASLVGIENILKAKVIHKKSKTLVASVLGQQIEARGAGEVGEAVSLCIRAEDVNLTAIGPENPSKAKDALRGRVEKITSNGPYKKVYLKCGFPLVAYVTNPAFAHLGLKQGCEVLAHMNAADIHVIRNEPEGTF